jgi:hypothetical protein
MLWKKSEALQSFSKLVFAPTSHGDKLTLTWDVTKIRIREANQKQQTAPEKMPETIARATGVNPSVAEIDSLTLALDVVSLLQKLCSSPFKAQLKPPEYEL